jgi:hypothetical protein
MLKAWLFAELLPKLFIDAKYPFRSFHGSFLSLSNRKISLVLLESIQAPQRKDLLPLSPDKCQRCTATHTQIEKLKKKKKNVLSLAMPG